MDRSLHRLALPIFSALLPLAVAGCHPSYSPNTYAANAAQVEAAVQRGVIIGVRPVLISATGAIGAAAGGAAGGVAGAQLAGGPVTTALGAIGGTLVGGIGGTVASQAVADTKGWEYIVQEPGAKLVSITQTSVTALPVGLSVLVISDSQQARIVPDYTVQTAVAALAAKAAAPDTATTAPSSSGSTAVEINLSPLSPDGNAASAVPNVGDAVLPDPTVAPTNGPAAAAPPSAPAQAAPNTKIPTTAAPAGKPGEMPATGQ
jgi:outer membrane lipoprotein SlyB